MIRLIASNDTIKKKKNRPFWPNFVIKKANDDQFKILTKTIDKAFKKATLTHVNTFTFD